MFRAPIEAQLSPGPLSRPHAGLEGSRRCLDCHRAGQAVAGEACLGCHGALRARLDAGRGLHARPEYRRCEICHAEHNGVEFELIHWGPQGRASFDHRQAGFALAGAHASLECDRCHQAARLPAALRETRAGVSPETTFLGLGSGCRDCHADPHQASLGSGGCETCHDQRAWKPAPGFDHQTTGYPLTGAHRATGCVACHRQPPAEPVAQAAVEPAVASRLVFSQFRDRPRPACAACHVDAHRGRLGEDCDRCHSTAQFDRSDRTRLDHDRTVYPLRGAHRAVACAACHPAGRGLRIAGFARCETCHADEHGGQLARGPAPAPACDACHGVEGFRPARYTLADHARGAFDLRGAHRAVPCAGCHPTVAPDRIEPALRARIRRPTVRLRLGSTTCGACHDDPHRGGLDRYAEGAGCAGCHGEDDWRQVRFDHQRSDYPLRGRHRQAACAACHRPDAARAGGAPATPGLRLTGLPRDCAGCHVDPHAGQLARDGTTRCERCHAEDSFEVTRAFDHRRDSRYPLDGAHAAVPCAGCHRPEAPPRQRLVRYRPLPTYCEGCHAGGAAATASAGTQRP